MKSIKLLAIILVVFLAVPLISAAEKYYLQDFSTNPQQGIILEEGDVLQFELLGAEHHMRLKEIDRHNTSIKLMIYPFKEAGIRPSAFGLNNKVYVDLDRDDNDDLMIDIYRIEDGRVTLIFVALDQEQPSEDIQEIPEGQGLVVKATEKSNYQRTFFIIGMIIVALLGILAYRKSKSMDIDEEKPKKEH